MGFFRWLRSVFSSPPASTVNAAQVVIQSGGVHRVPCPHPGCRATFSLDNRTGFVRHYIEHASKRGR